MSLVWVEGGFWACGLVRGCVGWLSVCICVHVEKLVGIVGMLAVTRLDPVEGAGFPRAGIIIYSFILHIKFTMQNNRFSTTPYLDVVYLALLPSVYIKAHLHNISSRVAKIPG
jgi:hypothetical protein